MTPEKIILLTALTTFVVACDSSTVRATNTVTDDTDSSVSTDSNGNPIIDTQSGSASLDSETCIDTPPLGDNLGLNGAEPCQLDTGGGVVADGTGNGNGNGNGNESGRINTLGLLKLDPDSSEDDFARALFGSLQSPLTAEEIQNFYAPTVDTCQVTPVTASNEDESPFNVYEQRLDLINAGETVLLSSNEGTYATLNSIQGSTGPIYQTQVALNVDPPPGLTVDVVGGEFPAFSDVAISEVPALQITNPGAGQNIDAFNFFQWDANNTSLSVIEIYTSGIAANGEEVLVGCTAVDDGAFSFPVSVRTQLGAGFDDDWTAYLRIVYNIARNGDALLITANSVRGTQ